MKPMLSEKEPVRNILRRLNGEAGEEVPFWLMRQAGRYLPEYRGLRKKAGSFLDLCYNPDMAAEVTLQPIDRFGMDAAIIFSDILVIPHALGQKLDFQEGEGPVLGPLVMEELSYDAQKLAPVYEAIRKTRQRLSPEKTLIGFAGAPWTVACYMVDGRGGGDFQKTKIFAYAQPEKFDGLVNTLVDAITQHLADQVRAGADTVQIFDSWAGLLPEPYFTRWVIKPAKEIRSRLQKTFPGLPVIGFPRGAGMLYSDYANNTGMDAVSLDTQTPVAWAKEKFKKEICLQGNLDPVLLLTGGKAMEQAVLDILKAAEGRPFVFNLGHGIIKETPPEHVAQLAKIIRGYAG